MSTRWQDRKPARRNRYLDWWAPDYRDAPPGAPVAGERWCPVRIKVHTPDKKTAINNLDRLRREIAVGKIIEPIETPIRCTPTEARCIEKLMNDYINDDGGEGVFEINDPCSRFFIYLMEEAIYSNGNFRSYEHFEITFEGWPRTLKNTDLSVEDHPHTLRNKWDPGTVAIGIIDDAIAFAHDRFHHDTYGTRIEAIWVQEIERLSEPNGIYFGRTLYKHEIDRTRDDIASMSRHAVHDKEIYDHIQVEYLRDATPLSSMLLPESHGTHVLDIAAGMPSCDDAGLKRPILAVQLPHEVTADTSGTQMSYYVVQGVQQLMRWADEMDLPLVINFSYGIFAGPKDGTHPVEEDIDALVKKRRRTRRSDSTDDVRRSTHVVLPAGNGYDNQAVALMSLSAKGMPPGSKVLMPRGRVTIGESEKIYWQLLPDDLSPSFVEIWFPVHDGEDTACPISVELAPPGGECSMENMPTDGQSTQFMIDGDPVCAVYYDRFEANSHSTNPTALRGRVIIAANPTTDMEPRTGYRKKDVRPAPFGLWSLEIKNLSRYDKLVEIYVQRDDTPTGFPRYGRQSFLVPEEDYVRHPEFHDYVDIANGEPITPEGTLSAIATGETPIVVGASTPADTQRPAPYSASGPTSGRDGPDVSAFTEAGEHHRGYMAAGVFSGSVLPMSGTSMAAPQVARFVADRIEEGAIDKEAIFDLARFGSHTGAAYTLLEVKKARPATSSVPNPDPRHTLGKSILTTHDPGVQGLRRISPSEDPVI